ncbi:hypothetical protein [Streptococcus ovuberis]|uniref:Uncharacterized protein n=1 Tax=Streptococcus ovuberis TaxID=1936207 RepID=A0A7X6S075_9STRE|nr:hypothetical protein [Streptococcus ovuberis]NKZ19923.1 hypothetical protein [Streptococcus ovuberis]
MKRIILSRELSAFQSMRSVKVYIDGKHVRTLSQEGEVQTYPIVRKEAQVAIKVGVVTSKPVTVKAGQTVFIYPAKKRVFMLWALIVICLMLLYWGYVTFPISTEKWGTIAIFWQRVGLQVLMLVPFNLSWIVPTFVLEVSDDLPNGYFPTMMDKRTSTHQK